jgi:hypothetical protein
VLGKSDFGLWIANTFIIPSVKNREFWIRLYPALCATLTFPLAWLIIRRHIGKLAAMFAVLFMLLSPMNAYYSQDARPYAPWLLYTCIGAWFLLLAYIWIKRSTDRIRIAHWRFIRLFRGVYHLSQGLFLIILLIFRAGQWQRVTSSHCGWSLLIVIAADLISYARRFAGFASGAAYPPSFRAQPSARHDPRVIWGWARREALLFTLVLMGREWFTRSGKSPRLFFTMFFSCSVCAHRYCLTINTGLLFCYPATAAGVGRMWCSTIINGQ